MSRGKDNKKARSKKNLYGRKNTTITSATQHQTLCWLVLASRSVRFLARNQNAEDGGNHKINTSVWFIRAAVSKNKAKFTF
jgi:hypothetical protein